MGRHPKPRGEQRLQQKGIKFTGVEMREVTSALKVAGGLAFSTKGRELILKWARGVNAGE